MIYDKKNSLDQGSQFICLSDSPVGYSGLETLHTGLNFHKARLLIKIPISNIRQAVHNFIDGRKVECKKVENSYTSSVGS